MIIKGNTVGTTMPRADYAQTDPTKADYIKNKPDAAIEYASRSAEMASGSAQKAQAAAEAAQTTADSAVSAAERAQFTADEALPKAGGTMSGDLNMDGQKLTGLAVPTEDSDAVTKSFLEDKFEKFTANVPTTGWTTWADGTNNFGYVDVTVGGILATDEPDVDYNGEANSSSTVIYRHLEWWNSVYKVSTKADAIRIFATEVPTEEIPIKLKVVR